MSGQAVGSYNPPVRAVAYINPDIGMASSNPDVNPNSDCATPDSADVQTLSAPGNAASKSTSTHASAAAQRHSAPT